MKTPNPDLHKTDWAHEPYPYIAAVGETVKQSLILCLNRRPPAFSATYHFHRLISRSITSGTLRLILGG
jgi:hypothetical protein